MIKGRKSDKEKFAGAQSTYTIEALMHDGKALQSGTSHNFGDGFAQAFDIQYTDKNNKFNMYIRLLGVYLPELSEQSSWFMVMIGLVFPPRIAPIQAMIIPIAKTKKVFLIRPMN